MAAPRDNLDAAKELAEYLQAVAAPYEVTVRPGLGDSIPSAEVHLTVRSGEETSRMIVTYSRMIVTYRRHTIGIVRSGGGWSPPYSIPRILDAYTVSLIIRAAFTPLYQPSG